MQVLLDLRLQDVNKLWLHELVVVRGAQADDTLAAKLRPEVVGELPLMLRLHYVDDVGPLDQFRRQRVVCAAVGAGGGRLNAGAVGEYLLGSRAAEAVLAANEEEAQVEASPRKNSRGLAQKYGAGNR